MSIQIKNFLKTPAWQEIKKMFEEEIRNSTNTLGISEERSAEHIKMEVMTRNQTSKIMQRVLMKLERIESSDKLKSTITYR